MDQECIPQEILQAADDAIYDSLPDKSLKIYEKTYDDFLEWMKIKKTNSMQEKVVLAYFSELATQLSPATLWSKYSMLKKMMLVKNGINMESYTNLTNFIKKKNVGYKSKQAKTFSANEVFKYLEEAPDVDYLDHKVALIIGVCGACRKEELYSLTLENIIDDGNDLIITIEKTKTHVSRTFTVNEPHRQTVLKYLALRPAKMSTNHIFLNYQRGKCTQQVVGINKVGSYPRRIAEWLNLPDLDGYTGHTFRRTSATILAGSGASMTALKRHGGWKSTKVAEKYIDDSIEKKKQTCDLITRNIAGKSGASKDSATPSHDDAGPSSAKQIKLDLGCQDASTKKNSTMSIKIENCPIQ